MKRSILAPLCSAFVLPGLGQVLNRQIGKGLVMMAAITVLLIALMLKAVFTFTQTVGTAPIEPDETIFSIFVKGFQDHGQILLWTLAALVLALWIYSIVDAFYYGLRHVPPEDED